jgi:hypothetical protein
MILADLAEANKIANVYQPASSRRSCYSCLVTKDDLNNINVNISSRTYNNMKQAIYSNNERDYSIHPEVNAFWMLRYEIFFFT